MLIKKSLMMRLVNDNTKKVEFPLYASKMPFKKKS